MKDLKRRIQLALEKTGQPDLYIAAFAGSAALLLTRLLRTIVETMFTG
jgi:hypothetical protein